MYNYTTCNSYHHCLPFECTYHALTICHMQLHLTYEKSELWAIVVTTTNLSSILGSPLCHKNFEKFHSKFMLAEIFYEIWHLNSLYQLAILGVLFQISVKFSPKFNHVYCFSLNESNFDTMIHLASFTAWQYLTIFDIFFLNLSVFLDYLSFV